MEIDTRQLQRLELQLRRANETGFRIAREQTLNDIAFETRLQAKDIISKDFTLRNKFTTSPRNNPVSKAKRGTPFAEYGSTLDYMRKQEEGFIKQPDPVLGVSIPTAAASGETKGAAIGGQKRTKPVRKANRRNMMKMPSSRMRAIPRNERNAALIKEAIKTKRRYVILEKNGKKNLFKVRGGIKRFTMDRMYSIKDQAAIVRPKPWLMPATTKGYERASVFYFRRMDYQMRRMSL